MKTHILLTKNNEEVININEVQIIKFETKKILIKNPYRIFTIEHELYDKIEVNNYE